MTTGPKSLVELMTSNAPARQSDVHRPAPVGDNDARAVGKLLEQLKLIFPAWKRSFPTADAERRAGMEWTKALVEADCVDREQLARGMKVARRQDIPFFPSPGMFIKWCELTPESMGLPTLAIAIMEVARQRFTHPAVELAYKATRFESQTLSEADYRPVFQRAYEIQVRRVMNGEDLQADIMKALPTREEIQHGREYYRDVGRKGLDSLRKQLGLKRNGIA